MSIRKFKTTRTLVIALAFGVSLGAQQPGIHQHNGTGNSGDNSAAPRLIRYNGVYHNSSQQAQSGATGVTFSIYREQFDGTPLWSEIQNVQPGKDGSYSVLLGSSRADGMPIDLFATAEPRWLEIEADQVKQPRVLLSSVPYAMKAVDAETLGGLPASAYLRTGTPEAAAALAAAAPAASTSIGRRYGSPRDEWHTQLYRHVHGFHQSGQLRDLPGRQCREHRRHIHVGRHDPHRQRALQ